RSINMKKLEGPKKMEGIVYFPTAATAFAAVPELYRRGLGIELFPWVDGLEDEGYHDGPPWDEVFVLVYGLFDYQTEGEFSDYLDDLCVLVGGERVDGWSGSLNPKFPNPWRETKCSAAQIAKHRTLTVTRKESPSGRRVGRTYKWTYFPQQGDMIYAMWNL